MDISPAPKNVALKILDYHGGQNDPVYALGSSWLAGASVPEEIVNDAAANLRDDLEASKKDPEKYGWGEKEWKELEFILKAIQRQVDASQVTGGSGMREEILFGMSRSLWANAWMSEMETQGHEGELSGEITDLMPMVPPSADKNAEDLAKQIEATNKVDFNSFVPPGVALENWDSKTANEFGWYLVMQGLGTGVRWSDDHEDHGLKLPRFDNADVEVMNDAYDAVIEQYGEPAEGEDYEESAKPSGLPTQVEITTAMNVPVYFPGKKGQKIARYVPSHTRDILSLGKKDKKLNKESLSETEHQAWWTPQHDQVYMALQNAAERIGRANRPSYMSQIKRGRNKQVIQGYHLSDAHEKVVQTMDALMHNKITPEQAMAIVHEYDVSKERFSVPSKEESLSTRSSRMIEAVLKGSDPDKLV